MKLVVAIPTIKERGSAWEDIAQEWQKRTCQPIICEPSWRKPTWAAGLNEVWEKHPDADVLCCGSDDMYPQDDFWLPAIEPYLGKGCIAPQVLDPRFARFDESVSDGDEIPMSSFPILANRFLSQVFPLPAELHYYSDNLISDRLHQAGIPTLTVPSCVIVHSFDPRGRGAGMGDESTRMVHDRAIYKSLMRNPNS